MRRITTGLTLVAALAITPGAAAVEPTKTDRQNAAKQCKELRAGMGAESFKQLYGANKNGKNAFGKCVSKNARDEAKERKAAKSNAAKDCKAERGDATFADSHDGKTFAEYYGTGKNGKNAFGKCVSQKAKANKAAADEADAEADERRVNAARACRAEQKADKEAFGEAYGTKRNAFGKCVSQKARAQKQAEEEQENTDSGETA